MNHVRKLIGYELADQMGYRGENVGICILDSGIYQHADFEHRIVAFKDFVNQEKKAYDDYGHGTHIAGICAGSGKLQQKKYQGIAPAAHLMIGKVLNKEGAGKLSALIDGIDWCIQSKERYQIKILNISIGIVSKCSNIQQKELLEYIGYAWDSGLVTLCAAGNNGPKRGSVTVPGSHRQVITVGSVEYKKNGVFLSNYSGRGPTEECIVKPEIYAPGTNITSCSAKGGYENKTGTSMAVPIVAGAIALQLEQQPWMKPNDIKRQILQMKQHFLVGTKNQVRLLTIKDFLAHV